jgi:topoisomerase IA-like protein
LHSGRYGPYVKHGGINATLPDKDRIEAVTLGEAVALLAAKTGKSARVAPRAAKHDAARSARSRSTRRRT